MQIFVLARPETEATYGVELPFVSIAGRLVPLTLAALERLAESRTGGGELRQAGDEPAHRLQ